MQVGEVDGAGVFGDKGVLGEEDIFFLGGGGGWGGGSFWRGGGGGGGLAFPKTSNTRYRRHPVRAVLRALRGDVLSGEIFPG